MAAVIVPPSTTVRAPAGPRPRPALRVIEGGRSAARRAQQRVYRRRRIGALVVLGLVAVVGWLAVVGATSLLDPPEATVPSSAATAAAPPAAAEAYVVQPGDTLWDIAAQVAPGRDPRPVVDELADRAGSPALQAGQRIDISGLGG